MNYNRYCVIMAGGAANRFWPISRDANPKQFLDIYGHGKSFIRQTYERFSSFIPSRNILVVTLNKYADLVREQIPEIPEGNILLEPYSRNTAPCLAYSTYSIMARDPGATIIATPADHIIRDEDNFRSTMEKVMDCAEKNDVLMTVGIMPERPDTSYGYIQVTGGKAQPFSETPIKVKTFTEKPDRVIAEAFCRSGEFFWNSGIFAWKASVIKDEMERFIPDVCSLLKGVGAVAGTPEESIFLEKAYSDCPKVSIDYGVMEKTGKAWLLPGNFGWSDIDNWEALYEMLDKKDPEGNVSNTANTLFGMDSNNLLLSTAKKKLYAVKGLENYLVVDTEDALLICPRDEKQFKEFISGLGMPGFEEFR